MTISKTVLAEDNKVGNKSLSEYKNCFNKFESNSANGTFTLTTVNGAKTTFNIASTQYFRTKVAEAGAVYGS